MPRTKQTRRKANNKTNQLADTLLQELTVLENDLRVHLETEENKLRTEIDTLLKETLFTFSEKDMNKTLYELGNDPTKDLSKLTDFSSLRNITASSVKSHPVRSLSCGEDEGYLTAGSGEGTRKSRSRAPKTTIKKPVRPSRSLSRTKMAKPTLNSFATPADKGRPPQAGINSVTPKMNPSIPQVVLRRPKQGEMAISLQGSPLMVSSLVSDDVANVNIPLNDGRILTIQPQRGLRPSQIPSFSPSTRRQIETLRDNLNKVCALNLKH